MDKVLHFIAGVVITFLCSLYLTPLFAASVGAFAGFAKEIYDSLHPEKHTADFYDFIATVFGAFVMYQILVW